MPGGTRLQGGLYIIREVLGQGGFGITYRGSEPHLNRDIAIKEMFYAGSTRRSTTVQPSGATTTAQYGEMRSKFLEEAQTLVEFQRVPGIVGVYAAFEENNTAYMVMEFLKGCPLSKLISTRGKLPEPLAVRYTIAVCEALSALHRHVPPYLHRDIKPDNIMVTDEQRVVLVDFGSARSFAAGHTKRMTTMVTPGYAPLEQYGQQARFDCFTDIYAVGATLYNALVGEPPASATDRATGVQVAPPYRRDPAISRAVSEAVMWAIEIKADRRPQSAEQFIEALRGTSRQPNTSGRSRQTETPAAPPNPYLPRMRQLADELNKPLAQPPQQNTSAAADIQRRLAVVAAYQVPPENQCPACEKQSLIRIDGTDTGRCPICCGPALVIHAIRLNACPICHDGSLSDRSLNGHPIPFCPVCRHSILKESRRVFGIPLKSKWIWQCSTCGAELRQKRSEEVELIRFDSDPFGVGAKHRGTCLPTSSWNELSCRVWNLTSEQACDECGAEFDVVGTSQLALAWFGSDPYGTGPSLRARPLSTVTLAKMAAGIPATKGNACCPQCEAEFDRDPARKSLTLLNAGRRGGHSWLGVEMPIVTWYAASAGKHSFVPGWLCRECRTEFDAVDGSARLASTPSPTLSPYTNNAHSLSDWRRITAGVPDSTEEQRLRGQLDSLERQRKSEVARFFDAQNAARAIKERELSDLHKQALLGGFCPFDLSGTRVEVRSGQVACWRSPARRWVGRIKEGRSYWVTDCSGTLVVTSERFLFDSTGGAVWSKPLAKLKSVNITTIRNSTALLLITQFDDLQKPHGFAIDSFSHPVSFLGRSSAITLNANDLVALLRSLIERRDKAV